MYAGATTCWSWAARGHLLDGGQERVQVLGLLVPRVDREELDVGGAVRRLAVGRHVADGEADQLPPLLEEQGVAEGPSPSTISTSLPTSMPRQIALVMRRIFWITGFFFASSSEE